MCDLCKLMTPTGVELADSGHSLLFVFESPESHLSDSDCGMHI